MKYLILAVFCFCMLTAVGQISSGTRFIGGGVSLSSQTYPQDVSGYRSEYTQVSLMPLIGFVMNDQWAVGGQLGYGYSQQESSDGTQTLFKYNSKGITIGVFTRRFFPITEKFLFALNGQVQFERNSDLYSTSTSENKIQSYQITPAISPVFIFFPSERWGFEAAIGSLFYGYSRSLSNDSSSGNFGFNYGTVNLGFAYYFSK